MNNGFNIKRFLSIAFVFCIGIANSYGAVKYVKADATGANNGTSWANAYTNLQPAIDSAVSGDQVWVAAGTYKPSSWPNGGAGERNKHFSLKNGVSLYGGFSGIESNLAARNIDINKVICSGDIGVAGNNSDNCYQVFYHPFGTGLDNTAILDGVTILGGNANGGTPYNFGGGMYNSGCNPTISKCTFTSNNSSASGGGMYNYGCTPVVSHCSFIGNSAVDGGGIYNSNSSSTNVSGCFFSGNTASASGGGMFNTDSNPSVVNNTFVSNTAVNGGGIYNYFSFPAVNNCTFTGNTASANGGGIYCQYNSASTPVFTVKNCIFWNNGGAGKEIYKTSITASVSYCVVQGGFTGGTNIVTTDPLLYTPCLNGGFTNTCAITNASSAVFIPKSAASNTWNGSSSYDQRGSARAPSASRAAGAYEPSYGYPSILTTAVSEITKTSAVSGISFPDSGSGYTVTQKGVCWAETPGPTVNGSKTTDGAGLTLATSTITGLTEDTDYYLRAYAQLNDGTVIYGQEIQFKSLMIYYVVVGGAGNIDGSSWEDALGDLQVAITMASSRDEVWVAQGIYKPQSWPNGGSTAREKHFSLKQGVGVYGGFLGNETSRDQRDYKTNVTTLSGDIGVTGDNADNCYHVFYHPNGVGLDVNTVIDGVTVTAGYFQDDGDMAGVGMYNDNQTLKIQNCTFTNNSINKTLPSFSINSGAAIYNKNSYVSIISCYFKNNTIVGAPHTSLSQSPDRYSKGGAVYTSGGTANIQYCTFDSNSVEARHSYSNPICKAMGGAVCSENTNLTISFCLFNNNYAKEIGHLYNTGNNAYGGAVYNSGLSAVIENSTFYGNSLIFSEAYGYGGAIYNDNASVLINSCSFNNNSATSGGAIFNNGGTPTIKNSLLWGNGGADSELSGNVGSVSYSVIQGGYAGGSNIITSDPQLQVLADNGGLTQTIAIPGNSSAVAIPQYAGSNDWNGAPYLDQRDYGKRVSGVRAIGAYDPNSKASFAVNFSSGTNGSLIGTTSQTVAPLGNSTAITAVPDTNYKLNGWTGDYTGTANPLTISNVVKDMSVTANFTLKTYTVSFVPGTSGGSIGGTATQTIQHGSSCTEVNPVANTGYHFTGWTGDYVGSDDPLTISNVTKAMTITANFAINQYTLTYSAGTGGTLTGTSPQTVNHGSNGSPVTAAASTGYHFISWSDGVVTASRTDTNITAGKTVTANFAINQYTLTYNAGTGGTLTGTSPQTVNHGANGTVVTAAAITGYHFISWSDGVVTASRTDTNVTAGKSVTANFAINQYTLTYSAGTGGTLTGTSPQTVNHGSNGSPVTAAASTGYHFISWSDGVVTASRTDTNVTAGKTVTANFAINQYTLTYNVGTGGVIDGTSPQTVNHGSNGSAVVAAASTGYHFTGWSDGVATESRTDTNIIAGKTVTANFAINQYTLTYNAGTGGTLIGTSPQTVNHGANGSPVAAAIGTGYHFTGWSDGVATASRTDTNVTAGKTVTANFARNTATLIVGKSGNGSAGFTDPGTVNPVNTATAIPITAVADANNHFVNWTVNSGSATIANPNSSETTVTLNGGHESTATVTANFATGKLAATVNITGLTQTYNGTQLPVTVNTVPAGLKVNVTYKGVADEPMNAGSYPVVATIVHDNYAGSKTGTLVIAKANQTINFQALPTDMLFNDADYPLTAKTSSPLPVTYTSSNPAVATIVNDAIHIVGVGTATITAKQIGNINYNAATAISKALVIGKKSQTIEFNAFTSHAMGEKDFAPDATASSGLPVIYTSANLAVATIVSGKIHIVGKGSSVITAKQAGNANWNIAKEISQRLDVAVGTQEITFNALPDKFYGNADFAPGATTSSSSGIPIIYTSLNLSVATIVSGKIHIIGVGNTDITASQAGNVNWNSATPVTQTLTVEKGTPVITWANPLPIAYGTLLSATQLNATANVPGKFTYTPVLGRKLTAGSQTLTVNFAPTDAVRYNSAEKTVPLTVNRAVATVTIAGLSQTYNGEPRPVTVSTLPAGLIVNTTYNKSADAPTAIGSYTVLSTVDDLNGTGTKTGTLIISKGVQTINFPVLPTNLCFEGVDYVLGASASSGLPVTYTSSAPLVATITPDGKLHIVGAGTATITAKQTGNTNYNAAPVVAKAVTIGKKSQTIDFAVFDAHAMGDRDFSPGATAVSGLPITYISANPAVATIVNGKIHIVGKGSAKITASQAGNINWNVAPPISQTLNVAVGTQEITFNALPNKVYGTADFAAGATASSGLAVIYTSSDPLVATIVTGKIHITGVGTSTITASQIGNVNWNPANTVTQTLTVDKGAPVITWANPLPIAYGALLSATQLNATANIPGKFTYTPVLGRKLTAGPQTLTVNFAPTDAVRYNNAEKTVPLTVNRAVATVTIAGLSQTYNGEPRPVTVSTLPAGLTVNTTYNENADAPTAIGSYTVLSTVDDLNGTGTKTGTLIIAKGVQTINFQALPTTLIFNDRDYPLIATASSGLPITYTSSNPLVATIVNDAIHIVGAGTATITAKQTGNTNYNAAISVAKALTIGKRNQTMDFPEFANHASGDADFAPGATTDSPLAVIYTSATPAVATIVGNNIHIVGKGSSVITAKQVGNTNWNAASATRTLTVLAAAAPTITSQPSSTSVTVGHISSFTVLAGGMPTPGYRWQVSTNGGVVWNNLENTGAYSGVSTDTLTVTNAAAVMSRYQFRCAVSNRISSATSDPAILRVESETLNFGGNDDFATAVNWSAPTMSASKAGLLTFVDDSLEYTVSSPSADDIAMREWTSNVGSYTNNWAVQVDVHLVTQILSNDQYANLNLIVVNAADAVNPLGQTDHISVAIDRYDNGSTTVHNFEGNVVGYYAGMAHDTGTMEVANSSTDAALRISFDSATKELSSWYDADGATGGYSWTLLQKVNIGTGVYDWNMPNSGAFAVLLSGGSGGVTLSSGEAYFDNFQASTDLP